MYKWGSKASLPFTNISSSSLSDNVLSIKKIKFKRIKEKFICAIGSSKSICLKISYFPFYSIALYSMRVFLS